MKKYLPLLLMTLGSVQAIPVAMAAANYQYIADTAAPAQRQGMVSVSGVNWNCQGARCITNGPWATPAASDCHALAQQVGPVRSYGHKGGMLTPGELQQCNAGVATGQPSPFARGAQPIPQPGTPAPGAFARGAQPTPTPAPNNGKGNIVGPMFTPPAVQSGNAAAPIGSAPGGNAVGVEPNRDFNELWQHFVSSVSVSSFARQQTVERLLRNNVVSDKVIKSGSKISGGWREYAADLSWRRVVFTLDGRVATIVFSDGKPGSLLPSVTRFARSGPGSKGSPATYNEVRTFAGTTPDILDKAKTSSPIPSDVATRIREIGGDIQVMQQFAELMRISELGSALDAALARGPREGAGNTHGVPGSDFPGGGPRASDKDWKGWSDPRSVAAGRCPGCASGDGDEVISSEGTSNADGSQGSFTTTTRHKDNSTTTTTIWVDDSGFGVSTVNENEKGQVTSGGTAMHNNDSGDTTNTAYVRNVNTGEIRYINRTRSGDGSTRTRTGRTNPGSTPSETSGRGGSGFIGGSGFEFVARIPWLLDAQYEQWNREHNLAESGGDIRQPGRGVPTLILNEGPEVGANGVVNCGDSNTNLCARTAGVAGDPHRGWGNISQPGRGGEPGTPTPGTPTEPRPPIPEPEPQ